MKYDPSQIPYLYGIIFVLVVTILVFAVQQTIDKLNEFLESFLVKIMDRFDGKKIATIAKLIFRKLKGVKLKRDTNRFIKDFKKQSLNSGVDYIEGVQVCESEQSATTILKSGKKLLVFQDSTAESQSNINKIVHEVAGSAIPNSKAILTPTQRNCIHFKLTTSILERSNPAAVRTFVNDHRVDFDKWQKSDFYKSLDTMGKKGFFDRIFVCDMMEYGGNSYNYSLPVSKLQEASAAYAGFLENLSRKYMEENINEQTTNLGFQDAAGISSNVMLVGTETNVKDGNFRPYVEKAKAHIANGVRHLYVISYNQPHNLVKDFHWVRVTSFYKKVIKELQKNNRLHLHSTTGYKIQMRTGNYPVQITLFKIKEK